MTVFISYSTGDVELVNQISNYLRHHAEVTYWSQNKSLGEPDWDQIFAWIDEADIVLVVVTDKAVSRGLAIGIEVGYAKKRDALIIPLIADGVPISELGFLKGITFETLERQNPGPALEKINERIIQLKRQETVDLLLAIGAVAVLIWLGKKVNQGG